MWFTDVERIERGGAREIISAQMVPPEVIARLTATRASIAGMSMDTPRIMGILNVTPDSFSDGGMFNALDTALSQARQMVTDGADILDVGGRAVETIPISIDTRKAAVAQAGLQAGANLVNDVAAFTFDPDMAQVTEGAGVPCCLMHAQGTPETMQDDPKYDDVVLDVYDYLAARIRVAEAAGIRRDQIVVDPGIGFGKTLDHNLTLLKNLSIFHGLGCAVLLGASRKRFIGTLGNAPDAKDRMPGSVAIALHGVRQGMQILRVHDTLATRQAISLQMAVN